MRTLIGGAAAALLALAGAPPAASTAWLQWGGPNRNFVTAPADLATSWPPGGPRRIWERPLGDGFSSIVTDGSTVYTLYRDGAEDESNRHPKSTKVPWRLNCNAGSDRNRATNDSKTNPTDAR